MKKAFTAFMVAMFCFAAQPSYAQVIDDAGAAKLKAIIQEDISYLDDVYTLGLKYEGEVTVIQHDGYYQVTLPAYTIDPDMGGIVIDIGKVVMNVVPEGDDLLNKSIALPTPVVMKNAEGTELWRLDIGKQKSQAQYVPSIQVTPKYNYSLQGVKLTIADAGTLSIDDLVLMMNLERDENGYYSGPSKYEIKGIKFQADHGEDRVNIGSIVLDGPSEACDMAGLTAYMKGLGKVDPAQMAPEEIGKFLGSLWNEVLQFCDSGGLNFSMKDLEILSKEPDGTEQAIRLEAFGFGLSLHDMRSEKNTLGTTATLKGLSIPCLRDECRKFLPRVFEYKMKIVDLPAKALFAILLSTIQPDTGEFNPADPQVILKILSDAGTKYVLESALFETEMLGGALDGGLRIDAEAANGLTALFHGKLRNLGETITYFETMMPDMPSQLQDIYWVLMLADHLVQPETESPEGQDERLYELQVTREGAVLVNGQDIMEMAMEAEAEGEGEAESPPPEQEP
jgi:hypothetical protein